MIGLSGRRVRVGIEAPASVRVMRSEHLDDQPASPMIESAAEHVVSDEFQRLQSELSAIAELSDEKDRLLAQQVASEAIERMERIQRLVQSSLRDREAQLAKSVQSEPAVVRQRPSNYTASVRRRTCVA